MADFTKDETHLSSQVAVGAHTTTINWLFDETAPKILLASNFVSDENFGAGVLSRRVLLLGGEGEQLSYRPQDLAWSRGDLRLQ